jgi:hypothetical protein
MCVVSGQSGTEALFRRVSKGAEKRLSALSCLFVLMQHPNSHRMHLRSVSYLGFFLKNSDIFRYSLNSEGNRHSIETYIRMRFIKYLAVIDFYTYNLDKTCSLECTSWWSEHNIPCVYEMNGRAMAQAVSRRPLRGGPVSIPQQFTWDLWCNNRHWDRLFSEYFYFSLSVSFHQCSILIFMYTLLCKLFFKEGFCGPLRLSSMLWIHQRTCYLKTCGTSGLLYLVHAW